MRTERVGETLGVWRLGQLVGSGGMGDVYRAERIDGVVTQSRAIKILRAAYRRGSPDEAEAVRPLDHPNIAKCFDAGLTSDGHRYLVMEYIEGKPITDYADQKGLSIHGRIDLFLSACRAIEYAHQHLVVHLDIKPGNILVNRDGVVKVIDFGVARRLDRSVDAESPRAFSGPYASPEQIQFDSRLGFPADIYALGAVLYEILSGHEPFDPRLAAGELERQILEETPRGPSNALMQAKLKQSLMGQHFRLEPEAIARMRGCQRISEAHKLVSGDLDIVCLFALRKEAGRRYRAVDDLRSDLERVLEGRRPAIARSGDPLYSALRAARRKPLAMLLLVAGLAATLASYTVLRLFSARTDVSLESRGRFNRVTQISLDELNQRVRPRIAADSVLRGSLETLDAVERIATPVEESKSLMQEFFDESILQMRRITGRIPKDDLPDVP